MASKSKPKPAPQAKPVAKARIQDMTVVERRPLPPHAPSGRSLQASLLTLTGFGATLFGLALTLLPKVSWKGDKIMVGLDYLGVHGGALVMGGLMLVGLGMVLRQVTQTRAILAQSGEDTSLLESVAADVLQVGAVLEGLESAVRGLKGDLVGLHAKVVEAAEAAAAPAPEAQASEGGLDSEDAIFRLAASMDKVGARIEERLKSQFTDLTGRIGQVESSIQQTTLLIEQLEAPAAPVPAPVQHQAIHYPNPALHQTAHRPAPAMHQTAHRPAPPVQPEYRQGGQGQGGQGPADPRSLGLLDELDDDGVASPLPAEQPLHFDRAGELSLQMPPPAVSRWDDPPRPAPSLGMESNPLMADPEMRAALESIRRQGRPG